MTTTRAGGNTAVAAGAIVLPLALAQFIASYAGSNMNVAISTIADELNTPVSSIQTTITLFTLTMAALMIPGSKLTEIWGRKFCFILGLIIYGSGALIAALAPGIGVLTFGYSLLEGVGSALMIPPIYILITVVFTDVKSRAKWFGVVSGAAGLGSAAGPLIGGLITSYISWRASFLLQVIVVATIAWMARRIADPPLPKVRPKFDLLGAILSAAGLFLVVFGILQTGTLGWTSPTVWLLFAAGVVVLAVFFLYVRAREHRGRDPLVSINLFKNRTSNLGLLTQNMQWLILQGSFFVISVYLQQERGYNAIQTGLMLLPSTIGILASSAIAQRLAARRAQRTLIRVGFTLTIVGLVLLMLLANATSPIWTYWPGLFLMGFGVGVMLTSSVNVVQSAWPENKQGDISGVSRSVSNLGSSLGVATAGSVLVAAASGTPFLTALIVMAVFGLVGWIAALLLPRTTSPMVPTDEAPATPVAPPAPTGTPAR
jgi:MFS family permease